MVGWLIVAAALQAGQGAEITAPVCALVTPRGDAVGFQILPWDRTGVVGLLASRGSVWPTRTLPGSPAGVDAPPAGKTWLAFGGGDGLVLELGTAESGGRQTATLLRRRVRRPGLPLAFGFCEPGRPPTIFRAMDLEGDPRAIGADIAAFDPAQWPEESCGLLLSDGRRMAFRFRLTGPDRAEFSSPQLWSGRAVSAPIRWLRASGGVQLGQFERRGGPSGTQSMIVDSASGRAAKMIYLREIGDRALANQSGYGICGYVGLVRRAVREN